MKKLILILALVATVVSNSFAYKKIVDSFFFLVVDGVEDTSDNFKVSESVDTKQYIVTYNEPYVFDRVTGEIGQYFSDSDIEHITVNGGTYATILTYGSSTAGTIVMNVKTYTPPTLYTEAEKTAAETASYNSGYTAGAASVVCEYSEADVTNAFNDGIASVVCPFAEADIITAYNNGYASGYSVGIAQTPSAIAKAPSTMNINVYPTAVAERGTVRVECDNLDEVKVISTSGQVIDTYYTNEITAPSVSGMYILQITDYDGNTAIGKIIVE